MQRKKTILTLGILTLITPFLGIPNSAQDWLIAIYGLILILLFLIDYFSVNSDSNKKDNKIILDEKLEDNLSTFVESQPVKELEPEKKPEQETDEVLKSENDKI